MLEEVVRQRTIILGSYVISNMNIQVLGPHTDKKALCENTLLKLLIQYIKYHHHFFLPGCCISDMIYRYTNVCI